MKPPGPGTGGGGGNESAPSALTSMLTRNGCTMPDAQVAVMNTL